jgi:hypothetical protein
LHGGCCLILLYLLLFCWLLIFFGVMAVSSANVSDRGTVWVVPAWFRV